MGPTNIPIPAGPLIGRESELREVVDLFHRGGGRLVTRAGSAGVGKTRLAICSDGDGTPAFWITSVLTMVVLLGVRV